MSIFDQITTSSKSWCSLSTYVFKKKKYGKFVQHIKVINAISGIQSLAVKIFLCSLYLPFFS